MWFNARISVLFLATLAACTTLTNEERAAACLATDWGKYGLNDGILGVAAGERTKKFADCNELGYSVDVAAYQAGRAEGLLEYCTVENGYDVGYAGRGYPKVCPPELEISFWQGYERGLKERPPRFYPYFGLGIGYGHYYGSRFGYYPYRFGGGYSPRGHRSRRDKDRGKDH
jgi:hypothetical protein